MSEKQAKRQRREIRETISGQGVDAAVNIFGWRPVRRVFKIAEEHATRRDARHRQHRMQEYHQAVKEQRMLIEQHDTAKTEKKPVKTIKPTGELLRDKVLRMHNDGMTNKEIAAAAGISANTVRGRLSEAKRAAAKAAEGGAE